MRVQLPSGTPAELVIPTDPPRMGLVVAPDIFGLRPLFDDITARLAADRGYAVCAPEPFPGRELPLEVEPRYAAVPELRDDDVFRDLDLAAKATGCAEVGLIGFCMGGMYTLKAAGTGGFRRCVAFYGMIRVPNPWRSPGQGEPLDYLSRPEAAPTLAIIGENDHYTPPDDVEALAAMPTVTVVRYPGAEHGFVHDPNRPAHRPADAADAWARCYAHLES
jgi:carboxymethylenebutenolidase